MALIYVTPQATESARRLNISRQLAELVADREARPTQQAIQLFERRHPYLYKKIDNFRAIADVREVEGSEVICILEILKRGSAEFNAWNADPASYGRAKFEPIDQAALSQWVLEQQANSQALTQSGRRQPLPETLTRWLAPFARFEVDTIVMESEQWVRRFEEKNYQRHWKSYHQLVVEALEVNVERGSVVPGSRIRYLADGDGREVYYARFHVAGDKDVIYLLNALDHRHADPATFREEIRTAGSWIDRKENVAHLDEIARFSVRAYPGLIVWDADLWFEIQESEAANLALSGEETELLDDIRHAADQAVLPVFINGRAGSGKSTILYYLFADYLYRKAEEQLEGDLLFLTYSELLLQTAKRSVRRLMKSRADFLARRPLSSQATSGAELEFDHCFQPFREFVLSRLPAEVLVNEFSAAKFVDFRLFKQLYLNQNLPPELAPHALRMAQRGLSPDLCWHVIRTFIKGYRPDGYLSPEEYDDIPNKEKSVSSDIYRTIYEVVWDRWYRHITEEEKFWDNQDLVRNVLENKWIESKYAAVFCDEAQDFTRIEIELIMSLLVYQAYDLGWQKRLRLPFALAGDPFQTLNPTGFRWEAIKAAFYDEVVSCLDTANRGLVEFQYKELSYNYRSEAPIVRLSNLFQLWRHTLFDVPEAKPQRPWRDEHIIPPRLYILGKSISEAQFLEMAQRSVVIVPCEQNQEQEFWQQDPVLSRLSLSDGHISVLSPMLAKGLEFTSVILYKFGQHSPEGLFEDATFDTRLSMEYFLNKLYVGATRAKKYLLIVDTEEGERKLWAQAQSAAALEAFRQRASDPHRWTDDLVGTVTEGSLFGEIAEEQDPREIAEALAKGGRDQQSAELLRQAMEFYRRAGLAEQAEACRAEALELDGQFGEAGAAFERLGRGRDAERCYWKGLLWASLNRFYLTHTGLGDPLRRAVTVLMTSEGDFAPALSLGDVLLAWRQDGREIPLAEIQYQIAFRELFRRVLSEGATATLIADQYLRLAELLDQISPLHRHIGLTVAAEVYYRAERYAEAVRVWEAARETSSHLYFLAKARVASSTADRIRWLDRAGKFVEVVEAYESDLAAVQTDSAVLQLVARAYTQSQNFQAAVEVHWRLREYEAAIDLLRTHLRQVHRTAEQDQALELAQARYRMLIMNGELELARKCYEAVSQFLTREMRVECCQQYIAALIRAERWLDALACVLTEQDDIDNIRRRPLPAMPDTELRNVRYSLARGIAESPTIADAATDDKRTLTRFLQAILSVGFETWHKHVGVVEMGAALEKVGLLIDALRYYEDVEGRALSPNEQLQVRERWLKVKAKQIERLETEHRDVRDIAARRREQREKAGLWKMSLSIVPHLPDYPALATKDHLEPEAVLQAVALQIEWAPPRCKIQHGETGALLLIDVERGDVIPFRVELNLEHRSECIHMTIPDWDFEGDLCPQQAVSFVIGGQSHHYAINE